LAWSELPAFMSALRERAGAAPRALEIAILCGLRTNETLGAKLHEFDLTNRLWTVPASRMKMKKEHRVPLSDRAVKILQALPTEAGNEHVFIGPRKGGLSHSALQAVLRRMERQDITVHGMRASFRTWAGEMTSFPVHVLEAALAHQIASAVERTYVRGDLLEQRRKLMEAWARYCSGPVRETDNVVALRAAQ
jgi:integrase